MIGNDGDEVLTFDEFRQVLKLLCQNLVMDNVGFKLDLKTQVILYRNVMSFYKQVAKQFEKLDVFCQNADEVDTY